MNTFTSLHQGTLTGTRKGDYETETNKKIKTGSAVNVEETVGELYFAIIESMKYIPTESESLKIQSRMYEIIKDKVSWTLARFRKEMQK